MTGSFSATRSKTDLRRMLVAPALLMSPPGSSTLLSAQCAGEGGNSLGFDMAPETSQRVVDKAVNQIPTPMAPGPVKPTWASLKENYCSRLVQGREVRDLYSLRHLFCSSTWQRVV